MRHAGILNKVCKNCNKGYSTKDSLKAHILLEHFTKIHCELPDCSYKTGAKSDFKKHLKTTHWKIDSNLIQKLIEKIDKLKPDFEKMKYA